jgi:hypothetical protein
MNGFIMSGIADSGRRSITDFPYIRDSRYWWQIVIPVVAALINIWIVWVLPSPTNIIVFIYSMIPQVALWTIMLSARWKHTEITLEMADKNTKYFKW